MKSTSHHLRRILLLCIYLTSCLCEASFPSYEVPLNELLENKEIRTSLAENLKTEDHAIYSGKNGFNIELQESPDKNELICYIRVASGQVEGRAKETNTVDSKVVGWGNMGDFEGKVDLGCDAHQMMSWLDSLKIQFVRSSFMIRSSDGRLLAFWKNIEIKIDRNDSEKLLGLIKEYFGSEKGAITVYLGD